MFYLRTVENDLSFAYLTSVRLSGQVQLTGKVFAPWIIGSSSGQVIIIDA